MDFLSGLAKGGDSKKPAGDGEHKPDLFASAKVVAAAAQAQYNNEPDKYDKNKAAAAAADLLDAAEGYGKLDETKGVGKYVEKAEDYLRHYGSTPAAASGEGKSAAPTSHGPAAPDAEIPSGDYMKKAAGEFLHK